MKSDPAKSKAFQACRMLVEAVEEARHVPIDIDRLEIAAKTAREAIQIDGSYGRYRRKK